MSPCVLAVCVHGKCTKVEHLRPHELDSVELTVFIILDAEHLGIHAGYKITVPRTEITDPFREQLANTSGTPPIV